ncbi:hypothetical protein [Kribbella sp. NBC_00889]|uniref:hypothetical protein n=1 Tax=Kribbella sp. NBC_00889 TaxID=2975974 RepID=UPI0038682580|nr:hypothetical protein OG817_22245 [Kribbella sp. NBC_00889]
MTKQAIGRLTGTPADAGWIGEAGLGPSYLDEGSGGPENYFTNRNTTLMTWNLLHLARMLKDAGVIPALGKPSLGVGRRLPVRLREPGAPVKAPGQAGPEVDVGTRNRLRLDPPMVGVIWLG